VDSNPGDASQPPPAATGGRENLCSTPAAVRQSISPDTSALARTLNLWASVSTVTPGIATTASTTAALTYSLMTWGGAPSGGSGPKRKGRVRCGGGGEASGGVVKVIPGAHGMGTSDRCVRRTLPIAIDKAPRRRREGAVRPLGPMGSLRRLAGGRGTLKHPSPDTTPSTMLATSPPLERRRVA